MTPIDGRPLAGRTILVTGASGAIGAAVVEALASDEAPFICGALVEITGAQAVA